MKSINYYTHGFSKRPINMVNKARWYNFQFLKFGLIDGILNLSCSRSAQGLVDLCVYITYNIKHETWKYYAYSERQETTATDQCPEVWRSVLVTDQQSFFKAMYSDFNLYSDSDKVGFNVNSKLHEYSVWVLTGGRSGQWILFCNLTVINLLQRRMKTAHFWFRYWR